MPEGDTIHYHANRIRPALQGHVPDEIRTPHRRFARDRWPERLAGKAVRSVDARGKHLFLRFEGGLTIHSHLRMSGSWQVVTRGGQWGRSPRSAWLVLRRDDLEVIQFNGPVLELMTDSRTRFDRVISRLGPDIVAREDFDDERYLQRLREDDPTRPIGDALLDQSIVAGMGTVWRAEACWRAQVDPWRPTGKVSDEEALALVDLVRGPMQQSALDGLQDKHQHVYGKAGRPCARCGAPQLISGATQGDENRPVYWCKGCQH